MMHFRSSGGNSQTISAILGIAVTADLRKAFSSAAGAMGVNAQFMLKSFLMSPSFQACM